VTRSPIAPTDSMKRVVCTTTRSPLQLKFQPSMNTSLLMLT
jgi:hypothetical protein